MQYAPVVLHYDVWGSVSYTAGKGTSNEVEYKIRGRNPGQKLSERCDALEHIQAELLSRQQARKGNLGGAAISLEAAMNLDSCAA